VEQDKVLINDTPHILQYTMIAYTFIKRTCMQLYIYMLHLDALFLTPYTVSSLMDEGNKGNFVTLGKLLMLTYDHPKLAQV
jgi:hypothetical protein